MSSLVRWQQIDRVLKARDEPIEVEWGKLPKRLRREVPFIERVIASGRRGKHMHRAEPLVSVGLDACAYAAGASGHQEGIDHLVGDKLDGAAQVTRPYALTDRLCGVAEARGPCALEIRRCGTERRGVHHRLALCELDAAVVSGDHRGKADRCLETVERAASVLGTAVKGGHRHVADIDRESGV